MPITTSKAWSLLFGLQVLIALALFFPFLFGQFYFAYIDIGSDSYGQVAAHAMHMARSVAREGFTGWSFETGLGGPTALWLSDVFTLVNQLGGPDKVLPLRIWVYLLKIVLGGASFFALIRYFTVRWETSVISALAYSFCGFIAINGQWDTEATAFIFFPLVLWAIIRHLRGGHVIVLPIILAIALLSGVFFVALGLFLIFTGLAFVLSSDEPAAMLKKWLLSIVPLAMLGYLLAAPVLLPVMALLTDSSRVVGGEALFQKIIQQSFQVNDFSLILAEIGGIFHKDIFGIGNHYRGYWNYLEGPGFFIGVLLFILIPQLWNGTAHDRKILLIALVSVAAYFLFPVFRYAAMGFAVPYFRVSTLWVSIVLLLIAARAVDQVLERGVNGRLLLTGVSAYIVLFALVVGGSINTHVWKPHAIKIVWLTFLASALLWAVLKNFVSTRLLPLAMLGFIVIETMLIVRPSFVEGRQPVAPDFQGFDDGTQEALKEIRTLDKDVFRIEKTYDSVSLADALAQDYRGVKSYSFNSRGVVDFNIGLGLIPAATEGMPVNYTNWLPNAGARFMLNSLLSVKYIIAREPVQWPGFVAINKAQPLLIYRNELALPLGIVQTSQITKSALARLSSLPENIANTYRDISIINAAVVDTLAPGFGEAFDLDRLLHANAQSFDDWYVKPALALQASGLQIDSFSSDHISGRINPAKAGILIFSIPFNQGWQLMIDNKETPMMRANFGMLAAPVASGPHTVRLDFRLPGLQTGLLMCAAGLVLLLLLTLGCAHRQSKVISKMN